MLQKWQAYHRYRQTYDETWKSTVDKVWIDYKKQWEDENSCLPIPRNKRFEVMNEFIRKTFNDETPEKKQDVEEYRKKLKEETDEVQDEDQNAGYQTYVTNITQVEAPVSHPMHSGIDKLSRTLMTIGESIVTQTGWHVSILVGGPMPREGGKIKTYMFVRFFL
jgi:hypothetical protein